MRATISLCAEPQHGLTWLIRQTVNVGRTISVESVACPPTRNISLPTELTSVAPSKNLEHFGRQYLRKFLHPTI